MNGLKQVDKAKLVKLLNLTTSEADNEALTALRLANKMIKEDNLTWAQILSGDLKSHKTTEAEREYAKGYRAGFKKGAYESRRPAIVKVARRSPANMVMDINRVSDLINKIMSHWDKLDPHQKHCIQNSINFLKSNRCLPVRAYDELMSISRSMWDQY